MQGFAPCIKKVVEVTGFEPATFWSRTKRATKLRYTSIKNGANKGTRTLDLRFTKACLDNKNVEIKPSKNDVHQKYIKIAGHHAKS